MCPTTVSNHSVDPQADIISLPRYGSVVAEYRDSKFYWNVDESKTFRELISESSNHRMKLTSRYCVEKRFDPYLYA